MDTLVIFSSLSSPLPLLYPSLSLTRFLSLCSPRTLAHLPQLPECLDNRLTPLFPTQSELPISSPTSPGIWIYSASGSISLTSPVTQLKLDSNRGWSSLPCVLPGCQCHLCSNRGWSTLPRVHSSSCPPRVPVPPLLSLFFFILNNKFWISLLSRDLRSRDLLSCDVLSPPPVFVLC